ncbi:uncharacterized protein [Spinacia oleracea]|uniref:Uncharacterized protein n=1 Tax=Spinacia oleracea TaxID=3562 RepID=A0A9R0I7C7_SPIOL|nr:uncharacterized protein LOC110783938 [Spinacia oleracea]
MVALASLPYPFATFVSYKANRIPRKMKIQLSSVPSSSLRRAKRKNYLRPKILKTLSKPYNIPLDDQITAPIQPVEQNVEVPLDSKVEQSGRSSVEESEKESGLRQLEAVRNSTAQNLVGFGGISGRTVVKIVGSFVGLFILQTVISVWIMGSGNSKEKKRGLEIGDQKKDLRLRVREGEQGNNRNAFLKSLASVGVDELEMEAKISEIRKMAWEVREAEKRKKVESGEADIDDLSDDDSEDFESDDSRIKSGIVKEVDVRLSKLKKRYPAPSLNVNLLNKSEGPGKEGKDKVLDGKEEDNMLLYRTKHKFRSNLTTPEEKPKGFQRVDGVRAKHSNMGDGKPVERTGSGGDVNQMNVLEGTIPEKRNNGMDKEEKITVSQSSAPLKGARKESGSNGAKKKLDKGINGSTASGSNDTPDKVTKGMNKGVKPKEGLTTLGSNGTPKKSSKELKAGAKPERGLVQEDQHSSDGNILDEGAGAELSSTIATEDKRKMIDYAASTKSEKDMLPQRKGQPNTKKLGSKLSRSINKDEQENIDPWWSKLPYVLVILMQNGIGSEAQRGFYNIKISTDSENQSYSTYTVAFEDMNDARNFSYLLESAFEDLPDAAVDIAPLSTTEFKEVAETLDDKVFVVRKGELKLYVGQPLADVEVALRSLVR